MPKPYPPEFRRTALDLVVSGRTVVEVAGLLGFIESCLNRWKSRDLVGRGLKRGTTSEASTELVVVRERIRDLKEEVSKAAAAVEQVVAPKARFGLVADLHHDGVRVGPACNVLGVSRSGYYELGQPGAVNEGDSPPMADRPDRRDPRRVEPHLRPTPGPLPAILSTSKASTTAADATPRSAGGRR